MTDAPKLSRYGNAALAYARMGWPVFTVQPRGKRPLNLCSAGDGDNVCDARLPARDKKTRETICKKCGTVYGPNDKLGFHQATTDAATITRWWTKEPNANVGIKTGGGLLFLDCDVPDHEEGKTADGEATLALWEVENEELPATPHQRTGSKKQEDGSERRGIQYAFKVECEIRNSASKLGPGVDIRGDGGYVVVAPSYHPSGVNYQWDDGFKPSQIALAPAPQWLLDKIIAPKELEEVTAPKGEAPPAEHVDGANAKYLNAVLDGEYDRVASAPKGTRNKSLNDAAFKLGQYVASGALQESTVRHTLTAAAEKNGYAQEEGPAHVEEVIASGMSAGMKAPREVPERRAPPPKARAQLRVVHDNTKPDPDVGELPEEVGQPVVNTGWMTGWEDHVEFKENTRILQPKVLRNAIAILLYRREFVDLFRFNDRTQTVILTRQPPWTENGGPYPREMNDGDLTGFRVQIEKGNLGLRLAERDCKAAITYAARERHFDPALTALMAFVWDGKERLDHWLVDYLGADDNSFIRQAGSKWMIAAAKRVIHPGCKFDNMLVLEGPQGIMKSTALRVIAEALSRDAFSDRLSPLTQKDSMIELLGTIIIEVAELAAFKGSDADHVKRFLAAQEDKLRLPWDKTTARLPRGCVFAGTVNPDGVGWLTDPTGGRRFWPVAVTEIDIDGLRRDAAQLWAEARVRMEAGEAIWFEDETVLDMAHEAVMNRTVEDAWADKIDKFIAGCDRVTMSDILTEGLSLDVSRHDLNAMRRIGGHLTKRGWRKIQPKDSKGKTLRMWQRPKPKTLFSEMEAESD